VPRGRAKLIDRAAAQIDKITTSGLKDVKKIRVGDRRIY
jgi:hypothetical protein